MRRTYSYPESSSAYGTMNCPLRQKLRFMANRQATFMELGDLISDQLKLLLATLGFFFSGNTYIFCVWCWEKFEVTSQDSQCHPENCPKKNLAQENNRMPYAMNGSQLNLNLTEKPAEMQIMGMLFIVL